MADVKSKRGDMSHRNYTTNVVNGKPGVVNNDGDMYVLTLTSSLLYVLCVVCVYARRYFECVISFLFGTFPLCFRSLAFSAKCLSL